MNIRIELAGFGDDRPAMFGGADQAVVTLPEDSVVADAMATIGLASVPGLAVMLNNRSVGERERFIVTLRDGDTLAVLYALEGG